MRTTCFVIPSRCAALGTGTEREGQPADSRCSSAGACCPVVGDGHRQLLHAWAHVLNTPQAKPLMSALASG